MVCDPALDSLFAEGKGERGGARHLLRIAAYCGRKTSA